MWTEYGWKLYWAPWLGLLLLQPQLALHTPLLCCTIKGHHNHSPTGSPKLLGISPPKTRLMRRLSKIKNGKEVLSEELRSANKIILTARQEDCNWFPYYHSVPEFILILTGWCTPISSYPIYVEKKCTRMHQPKRNAERQERDWKSYELGKT